MNRPPPAPDLLDRLSLLDAPPSARIGVALAAVALAFAARWWLQPVVGSAIPFATFLLATIIATFVAGRAAGIVASIAGAVLAIYFFVPPVYSFAMPRLAWVSTASFLVLDLVVISCVHMAQMARRRSERLAHTSRLLFDELQHRVSNNLQVIGSLLTAQKRLVRDEAARAAIADAATRLTVVGRISRELYRPDGAQTDMADFLRRLGDAVLETSGRSDVALHFRVADSVSLAPERATPLALVFTEALSNALEHGLPDRPGNVVVTMPPESDGRLVLSVEDDGRGIAQPSDADTGTSLGLQIARQLARQLGGEFSLVPANKGNGGGTRATLSIAA